MQQPWLYTPPKPPPKPSAFDVQLYSVGAPPLAHDDERDGQSSLAPHSGSLFGPAVEGFAKRFTEAQKSSQLQHFLPKCTSSSSASSRPDLRRLSRQLNQRQPPRSTDLTLGTTLPLPETQSTPAQDRLGSGASEILLNIQAERGGALVSLPLDHPASSLYCVLHRRTEGRLSRQTLPTGVGERCARANRPSACGPKRNWACTLTD